MGRLMGVLGCALGLIGPAVDPSAAFADPMPNVVELFTSQGCSSCPPAEAFLGELSGRSDVITLAYHIDYWDNLGWKDPYSSVDATERQRLYAQAMGLRSIYTPQMVIDGKADVVGSDRSSAMSVLAVKREGVALRISQTGGKLSVDFAAPPSSTQAPINADVIVVAYTPQAETRIPRGENAGKTLLQSSIVRGVYPLGRWNGAAQSFSLDKSALPKEATMAVILVQVAGQRQIIGAAKTVIE